MEQTEQDQKKTSLPEIVVVVPALPPSPMQGSEEAGIIGPIATPRPGIAGNLRRFSLHALGVATTPAPHQGHIPREKRLPWSHAQGCGKVAIFLGLTIRSLGVVFGDIGTSVLYTYSTMFPEPPADTNDFISAASLILWSLIILVTIKYAVFVMMANNHGEGGIFALGGLLTGKDSTLSGRAKFVVTVFMILGAGLVLGDGAFTPSVSVVGAVVGLNVAFKDINKYVIVVVLVILAILFLCQPFGTSKIGATFGPIMLLWFSSMTATGIWRITQYPACFRALNPWEGLRFIFHNSGTPASRGFFSLSSVYLSITGLEALYADMGHFTAWPIRTAWLFIALPALAIQYLGQAALLVVDPTAVSNSFYLTPPRWAFWPMLVLATMAAIIASQAIISGSFSLAQQAIALGLSPPFHIKHTSKRLHGQIFVPFVNWLLLGVSFGIVLGFGTSSGINHAYGVTVCTMMVTTTFFFTTLIHYYWKRSFALSVAFFAFFIPFDGTYWVSVMFKVPHGGWVALLISLVFFTLFGTWWYGEYCLGKVAGTKYQGTPIADFMTKRIRPSDQSQATCSRAPIEVQQSIPGKQSVELLDGRTARVAFTPSMGVFVSPVRSDSTPQSFEMFLELMHSIPDVIVFLQVVPLLKPHSEPMRVFTNGNHVYTVTIGIGFTEPKVTIQQLLVAAARLGLPEPKDVTVFHLRHIIKVEHRGVFTWIWRWPLLIYAQMKLLFPESIPSIRLEPHNTVMLGMICKL